MILEAQIDSEGWGVHHLLADSYVVLAVNTQIWWLDLSKRPGSEVTYQRNPQSSVPGCHPASSCPSLALHFEQVVTVGHYLQKDSVGLFCPVSSGSCDTWQILAKLNLILQNSLLFYIPHSPISFSPWFRHNLMKGLHGSHRFWQALAIGIPTPVGMLYLSTKGPWQKDLVLFPCSSHCGRSSKAIAQI